MSRQLVFLTIILLPYQFGFSQTTIQGKIAESEKQFVEGASVLLLNAKDSILIKGTVTSKSGSFIFEKISTGYYILACSYTGYRDVYSDAFHVNDQDNISIPTITLQEKIKNLTGVTVAAKKPLFEQQIDRMVINVASSITNTGTTALEVLMRSPGINVNQQNNTISMNGKDGVMVILNGKVNRMPMEALVQMLGGMSAANIERIELITTPPANFDAEGNAGFINIVLKKNTQIGTNGSFTLTGGYAVEGGPAAASSINFNHRGTKWNLYGDYSFSRVEPKSQIHTYRKVLQDIDVIESYQHSDRDDFTTNHNARLGLDYVYNKSTIFGVLLSGFSNKFKMEATNYSRILRNGNLDTSVVIDNPEYHPLDNYNANFNVQHKLKNTGQVTANIDYVYFKDANTLSYLNNFYSGTGMFYYSDKVKSLKETPIRFWVSTTDYSKKLGKNIDMESGAKATFSTFINDVKVEREVQNSWKIDQEFTSLHDLKESIFGVYTSFVVKLGKKTTSKAGIRYELINSVLNSQTKKNLVDKHYGRLFPTMYLSHAINKNNTVNLSLNRRITRPTFNDMAPFVYFVDPNTLFSGNPALQPAIADAVKIDYLLKKFVFSLTYTHEQKTITNFAPTIDAATNRLVYAAENQKHKDIVAAVVSIPITVTKWWTMQNNMSGLWQRLHAIYKGGPLTVTHKNFNINSTQSFTLPKKFTIELNGAYQSGGLFGIYVRRPTTSLNFGAQKKLGDKAGSLTFNITHFSGPPHLNFFVDSPEHNLVSEFDMRRLNTTFRLSYTKRFGSNSIKEKRNRTTGSEEERSRVQ